MSQENGIQITRRENRRRGGNNISRGEAIYLRRWKLAVGTLCSHLANGTDGQSDGSQHYVMPPPQWRNYKFGALLQRLQNMVICPLPAMKLHESQKYNQIECKWIVTLC